MVDKKCGRTEKWRYNSWRDGAFSSGKFEIICDRRYRVVVVFEGVRKKSQLPVQAIVPGFPEMKCKSAPESTKVCRVQIRMPTYQRSASQISFSPFS